MRRQNTPPFNFFSVKNLQRFNVAIGGALAVLVLVVGWRLHLPEGWPRLVVLAIAVAAFALCAWAWKPQKPTGLNSFALPLLFLLNFNLSGWWLLGLLLAAVWTWALTRKSSGDYDFGPGMALAAALIITVACLVGVGFGWALA